MNKFKLLTAILAVSIFISGCGPSAKQVGTNMQAAQKVKIEDINKKDKDGYTALHYASESGNLEIVEYLVQKGSNLDDKDNRGRTAVGKATFKGYIEIVKFLSDSGANLEIANNYGETPLHIASSTKKMEIFLFLIQKGANLDTVDNRGWTPLHNASIDGNLEIVKILVENYANVHISDKKGQTPLDIAKDKDVISYLTEVSSPTYKQMQDDFMKAKDENTVKSFETFIATYPDSSKVKEAELLITKIYQKIKDNPEKQKEILDNVLAYLEKKDVDGLLEYANKNPEVMEFARNNPQIYLLFTGPKELQVGKLVQYKNDGVSEKMLSSKVLNLHKPYKKFSIDEMQTLKDFGLTEDIIVAMIDVTTSIDDESRDKQSQMNILKEQEKLAKQNNINNIKSNNQNLQMQGESSSGVAGEVMKTVGKEVLGELIRQLF